jgi:hypothetical protein
MLPAFCSCAEPHLCSVRPFSRSPGTTGGMGDCHENGYPPQREEEQGWRVAEFSSEQSSLPLRRKQGNHFHKSGEPKYRLPAWLSDPEKRNPPL